ncbi:MAG TPA: hypothetical protein VFR85_01885 [Anaeromyxobacteraceae bacterium]|nr:hypothetical protein [Anaeromyxobacteraceae bacterium]
MRGRLLAAVALSILAACGADKHCSNDAQCNAPEQACRLTVNRCLGYDDVATLSEGFCRDRGALCSDDLDCVPKETCRQGTCRPDPSLCSGPPHTCPTGCTWTDPFPCACVCQTCPPP